MYRIFILSMIFSVEIFQMLSCNGANVEKKIDKQKEPIKYLKKTETEDYELSLKYVADSLVGMHCFTYSNGSKIDCCLDGTSIYLKRNSNNLYLGVLRSCYDDTTHNISISINKDTLILKILDEHIFLERGAELFYKKQIIYFRRVIWRLWILVIQVL